MRSRFAICIFFAFVLCPNTFFGQSGRTQIKWFIQASNDEGTLDSDFIRYVQAYNLSQDSIELVMDITTATCSFDAADSLLSRIAAGSPPDITALRYSVLWDHFLDLTPYIPQSVLTQMDTSSFHKFRNKNGLIYLPLTQSPDLFYYNKDMFDHAGIPYPPHSYDSLYADGESWDVNKLAQIGALLTLDVNGHNTLHPEFDKNHILQYGFHWAWNNGISFLCMFGPPQLINQDGSVSIPQYMRDGYLWSHSGIWQNYFIPYREMFSDTMQGNPLGSGRTAMVTVGSWYCGTLSDSTNYWDIAALPSYNGTHNVGWGESGFGILKTTKSPSKAMAVIMTIAHTIEFYATGSPSLPTIKNLRNEAIAMWDSISIDMDKQVILDGMDHRVAVTAGEAIRYDMNAWRILNGFRDYIWSNSDAQIDGGINDWLIPQLESIIQPTKVKNTRDISIPFKISLFQNFPNPFNPSTTLKYQISGNSHVSLKIYNILGREIAELVNETKKSGNYSVTFDTGRLASGIYFARLTAQSEKGKDFTNTIKITFMK